MEAQDGSSGGRLSWETQLGGSGGRFRCEAQVGGSGGKNLLEGGKILVVPVIRIALLNLRSVSLSPQATALSTAFSQTPLSQASSCCMIPSPLTYVAIVASILLPNLYQ